MVADDLDANQKASIVKEQESLEKNQNSVIATAKNILIGNNELS